MRNLAKNKWFVLIAKTPMEKQQWIDAIRAQKDRVESKFVWFIHLNLHRFVFIGLFICILYFYTVTGIFFFLLFRRKIRLCKGNSNIDARERREASQKDCQ